jgi:HSP20 family protein
MNVMRFDPFREFDRLASGPRLGGSRPGLAMDAYRREGDLVLQFDLPGIDPESVDITVDKNVLTVSAERHSSHEEGDKVIVTERRSGRFVRTLRLGEDLDVEHVGARTEGGVLTITIPVAEHVRARRIPIESGSPAVTEEGEAHKAA